MPAIKRIPVTEPALKDLAGMRTAGQMYTDLLFEMIEDKKKLRLAGDMKTIEEEGTFVSLPEIKD
jgi:hypothetical protein